VAIISGFRIQVVISMILYVGIRSDDCILDLDKDAFKAIRITIVGC